MSPLVVSQLLPAAAVLRRRHLRRGVADHARRRRHLHPARAPARRRRRRAAASADGVLRLRRQRGRGGRRGRRARAPGHGRHEGLRVDPRRAGRAAAGSGCCTGTTAAATSASSRSRTPTSTTGASRRSPAPAATMSCRTCRCRTIRRPDTNSPSPEVEAVVDLVLEHARAAAGRVARRHRDGHQARQPDRGDAASAPPRRPAPRGRARRVLRRDPRGALLRQEPRAGSGRRAGRDHPLDRLRQERARRSAVPLRTAARRRRRAAAERRGHPREEPPDAGRLVLVERHGPGAVVGRGRPASPPLPAVRGVRRLEPRRRGEGPSRSSTPFEIDVRDTLAAPGPAARRRSTATSGYWIDFAVCHPVEPGRYRAGDRVRRCDATTPRASARDRDRLRQEQLERLGWTFHRIWSTEWFHDRERVVAKVLEAYERALDCRRRARVDRGDGRPDADGAAPCRRPRSAGCRVRTSGPAWRSTSTRSRCSSRSPVWIESDDVAPHRGRGARGDDGRARLPATREPDRQCAHRRDQEGASPWSLTFSLSCRGSCRRRLLRRDKRVGLQDRLRGPVRAASDTRCLSGHDSKLDMIDSGIDRIAIATESMLVTLDQILIELQSTRF